MSSKKLWQISAIIPFPMEPADENGLPLNGEFPARFTWKSRIVPTAGMIGSHVFAFRKYPKADFRLQFGSAIVDGKVTELAELISQVVAVTEVEALDLFEDDLESACDALAFITQMPIHVLQLEVLDFSEPTTIGEQRKNYIFPFPSGYQHPKFHKSVFVQATTTDRDIELKALPANVSKYIRAAFRWYHKALAATADVDQFVWLFVVLELLCKESGHKVSAPYITECKHEISNCPVCNQSVEKIVLGKTIISFLVNSFGLSEKAAKELWSTRQVVHGNNLMTRSLNKDLSADCLQLLSIVNLGLKRALGLQEIHSPRVVTNAGPIVSQPTISGQRSLTFEDFVFSR